MLNQNKINMHFKSKPKINMAMSQHTIMKFSKTQKKTKEKLTCEHGEN